MQIIHTETYIRLYCRLITSISLLGATIITGGDVPDGSGRIWLDNVECTGSETRLVDCRANPLGTHNCGHSEDAGVMCAEGSNCTQGALRLQDGIATRGRLEICYLNRWGTVCDDRWDDVDAMVACRQLGFPSRGLCGVE